MKIGFIGCGNMASAMIGGILKKGIFTKERSSCRILRRKAADEAEKSLELSQQWKTVRWQRVRKLLFLQ